MKAKLKVLVLSHSSELSGAERSMMDTFDYWVSKGWVEPHFIIRIPIKNLAKELKDRSWPHTAIHYTNWSQRNPSPRAEDVFRNALYNTRAIFEIEELIKKIKPDVVMTNTIVAPWAALAAHFQQVPHVWFVREYGDIDHGHIIELGREKMLQDIDTLSSLIVTNSNTLAEHVSRYANKEKVTALYTPFNLDLLERKSRQKSIDPFKRKDSLKLVITGRIAPSKGQPEAAEAVGELTKAGFDVELCIIGTPAQPEDANSLNEVIKKYDIEDRVHLVGHQSNPLAILAKADVGVMASKQEAFGRVTFEYMVTGRPVVGANSGATPEMIEDGKNGYLYVGGDPKSLVAKLRNYAEDKSLVEKHGAAGRAKAQQMMKGPNNADALYEKIQKILKDKSPIAQPLNFSHRWLEYPGVAEQYIKDSGVISLKRMIYHRLRHRAKWTYLTTMRAVGYARRGFKRARDV
jgi:glycosyltransferase involved in cell wall biosynthesis